MRLLTLLSLALVLPVSAHAPDLKKDLIGIWQVSPELAAGWQKVYRFFPNGKLIINRSQFDLLNRELERRGTWKLDKGTLTMAITSRLMLQGGKVDPQGGFEGEPDIVGAKEVVVKLSKPSVTSYRLGTPSKDGSGHLKLAFGKQPVWKHRDDPSDYQ